VFVGLFFNYLKTTKCVFNIADKQNKTNIISIYHVATHKSYISLIVMVLYFNECIMLRELLDR